MSNVLVQCPVTNPYGKPGECGKFTVDIPSSPFMLSDIAMTGHTYTFSCWVRSDAAGSVTVNGMTFPSTTSWQSHAVTFTADDKNVRILFGKAGTYYIYHPQLELGNKPTDWTPAPEDVDDSVNTLFTRIEQNAEQIALRATKDEMKAAIEVSADSVTSTVSKKIDDIDVGGRNYILKTMLSSTYDTPNLDVVDAEVVVTVPNATVYAELDYSAAMLSCLSSEFVASFDAKYESEGDVLQCGLYFKQPNEAGGLSITSYSFINLTPEYARYVVQLRYKEGYGPEDFDVIRMAFRGGTGTVYLRNIKLESGNKAGDWTPAPEDVEDDISAAQNKADTVSERLTTAESLIEQLADRIKMLVRDANGESVMVQDGDGWYFSTSALQGQADAASQLLGELEERLGGSEVAINALSNSVDKFGKIAEFIRTGPYTYIDENGVEQTVPSIDLFETDSGFKLKITNTAILFTDGTTPLVTIDSRDGALTTPKVVAESEMQIGSNKGADGVWLWKRRVNGNLGLSWVPKGVTS